MKVAVESLSIALTMQIISRKMCYQIAGILQFNIKIVSTVSTTPTTT